MYCPYVYIFQPGRNFAIENNVEIVGEIQLETKSSKSERLPAKVEEKENNLLLNKLVIIEYTE